MSHIHIARTHTLGLEAARTVADCVAEELRAEHGVKADWEGDTLMIRGTGVRGELAVSHNLVDVKVRLGLMMRPFQRTLEKEINEQLDEHVGIGS